METSPLTLKLFGQIKQEDMVKWEEKGLKKILKKINTIVEFIHIGHLGTSWTFKYLLDIYVPLVPLVTS